MKRKLLLQLLILCIGITVVGAITIHEFFPHIYAIRASIDEINSTPSAWVNKMVVVEGKLVGPMFSIPEEKYAWNYELFGINETIETIGKKEAVVIGVLWNGKGEYNFENTSVVGVFREGRCRNIIGEWLVCYYIEAKKIDRT